MKKITYDSFLSKMTANKKAPSTNGAWASIIGRLPQHS